MRVQNAVEAERLEALKPPEKPADRAEISADVAKICRSLISTIKRRGTESTATEREILKTVGENLNKHVRAPRPGAPKRADRFVAFLENVLGYVVVFGGRPIFNRGPTHETATGNVVDLLDVLRPIMPPNFIPKKGQRMPRIERAREQHRYGRWGWHDYSTAAPSRSQPDLFPAGLCL